MDMRIAISIAYFKKVFVWQLNIIYPKYLEDKKLLEEERILDLNSRLLDWKYVHLKSRLNLNIPSTSSS